VPGEIRGHDRVVEVHGDRAGEAPSAVYLHLSSRARFPCCFANLLGFDTSTLCVASQQFPLSRSIRARTTERGVLLDDPHGFLPVVRAGYYPLDSDDLEDAFGNGAGSRGARRPAGYVFPLRARLRMPSNAAGEGPPRGGAAVLQTTYRAETAC